MLLDAVAAADANLEAGGGQRQWTGLECLQLLVQHENARRDQTELDAVTMGVQQIGIESGRRTELQQIVEGMQGLDTSDSAQQLAQGQQG